jgi:Spirocyclase AveC-like
VRGTSATSPTGAAPRRVPRRAVFGVACAVVLYVGLLLMCDVGTADGDRIHNPSPPRSAPTQIFLGIRDTTWFVILYGVSAIALGAILWWLARRWRATGRLHPAAGILLAFVLLSFVDPLIAWATYTAYNPDLIHFPVDWSWWDIAPVVQTAWATGAYSLFYMVPTLAGFGLWRTVAARTWPDAVAARSRPDSVMHRHPLVSTWIFGTVLGFLYDIASESLLINMNIWHYWQCWGPSVTVRYATLPLTEALWTGILVGTAMTVLQPDDRGRSMLAAKLSQRLPTGRTRLGEIGVIILLLATVYACYLASFTIIRVFDLAQSVESMWPFPATKVYDPYGVAQDAGVPGPYFQGVGAWKVR